MTTKQMLLWTLMLALAWTAPAQEAPLALQNPLAALAMNETTEADQTDIAVTVYNNNRALVRDRRQVKMLPGEAALKFMDVATGILPETVSLKSLTAPGQLRILEQNYEYDLMSPQKLMEKYVGRNVRLLNQNRDFDFYEVNAKLLSINEGPVYEIGGDIYLGHPGTVVLPEIPEELIAKPTLIWLLDNDGTDHEVEATYLTGGISWKADYVIGLHADEKKFDIEGWVTLDNRSGASYNNAELKLVAGDVNIVSGGYGGAKMMPMMEMARAAAPPPMVEESFAEYHLYTLQRRTTVKQNQSKQVSLLTAHDVNIRKIYEYRGNLSFYSQPFPPSQAEKVGVFLLFENKEENRMGMPLPAGIMRVYQEDSSGALQFAGEDRIRHTPKNEEVRLRLGNAFDIVGERKQSDYKRLTENRHEAAFEIDIRNHKEEEVNVDVVEPMPGTWTILEESVKHVKKDAQTAIFTLKVPANGEAKLTYRVNVRY